MLTVSTLLEDAAGADETITLPFDLRRKSRLRGRLDNGVEVALNLPRGRILRDGDCLQAENGWVIRVRSAPEQVSTVRVQDAETLARAAYHLGNRHVPLQVNRGWLRYQHDHVLDEMLAGLGLSAELELAPFEPEAGAYGGGHRHSHD